MLQWAWAKMSESVDEESLCQAAILPAAGQPGMQHSVASLKHTHKCPLYYFFPSFLIILYTVRQIMRKRSILGVSFIILDAHAQNI